MLKTLITSNKNAKNKKITISIVINKKKLYLLFLEML